MAEVKKTRNVETSLLKGSGGQFEVVLERVGPFKWRLVIPWPQSSSKLDVFELTPVALQPGA